MKWQEEQEYFWQWITNPTVSPDDTAKIEELLQPHSQLSQSEVLAIYNNAYHHRLINISRNLYPVLFNTLGKELYTKIWLDYLSEHPPTPGSINYIGRQLGQFLQARTAYRRLPALFDIAALEWKLIELFDKVDQRPFTEERLRALPQQDWAATVWIAKQDWALLESEFDLKQYWKQIGQYYIEGIEAGSGNIAVSRHSQPTTYLISRQNFKMQFQEITQPMSVFLNAIINKHTFSEICDLLSNRYPKEDIPQLSLNLLLESIKKELLTLPQINENEQLTD